MKEKVKKSWGKRILIVSLCTIGVFILLIGTLVLLYSKTDLIENAVVSYLNGKLEGQGNISYSSIKGSLINNIEIQDLEVTLENKLHLNSKYIELRYEIWPLFYNKVKISHVFIDHLEITLPKPKSTPKEKVKNAEEFSVDSTLIYVQNTSIIDSLLNILPELFITDVEVYTSSVHFKDQFITLSDINLKIDRISVTNQSYAAKLDRLTGYWIEKDFRLKNASFDLSGDREHFTLNQLQITTEKSKLSSSAYYRLKGSIDANLDVYELNVDLNDVYKLTGIKDLENGFVKGKMNISGKPLDFITEINLNGRWQEYILEKFSTKVDYDHGLIEISEFDLITNAGQIKMRGQGRERKGAKGSVEFRNINFNRLAKNLMPSDLNGMFEFDFKSLHLKKPTGEGSLSLFNSHIDSINFDTLRFALTVQSGNWTIKRPSFLSFRPDSRFELEGSLDINREINLTISSFDNNLQSLAEAFKLDSLNGIFDLQMRALGNLEDPTISGNLYFPFFMTDSVRLDSISLQLYVQNIFSERKGEANFQIDSGSVYSIPLNEATISAKSFNNQIEIEELKLQSNQNYLTAKSKIIYNSDSISVELSYFKAEYEKYWLENVEPINVLYDSSGITIRNLQLQGPQASILRLTGKWDNEIQDLNADIYLDNIEIEPFEQFWSRKFKIQGTINGRAQINTPIHDPNLDLDLRASNLVYNGIEFGDLTSKYQFKDSTLYISELSLKKDELNFNAGGNFGFSLGKKGIESLDFVEGTLADFKINWENINLAQFATLLKSQKNIKGNASGYLEVGGNISKPRFRQYLSLNDFEFGDYQVDSLIMFGQYNSGYIILDSLSAIFNETKFDLRGWQQYDLNLSNIDTNILNKPFNLFLRSRDDHIGFLGLINEQLESISGNYELELYIGGTPEKPAITQGFIKMKDGEILLSRVLDPIEQVELDLSIEDSLLTINKFSGYSIEKKDFWQRGWRLIKALIPWSGRKVDEGHIEAKGTIGLVNAIRPKLDMEVTMDELYINYFIENTKLLLTTESLKLNGQDTISIAGGVYIPKAEYEVDLKQMEKNVYLYGTTAEPISPPYLDINLDVQIPGGFNITSSPLDLTNNFRVGIQGDLQIIIEPGSDLTQISGHLDVPSGKYSSWNQNFTIKSGSIDFINPKVLNPDINIVAAKMLGPRLFELIITGNLEKLSQQIRVTENGRELDLPYPDKIAMLTLGTDVQQITSNTDSTLRNVGSEVATTSLLTAVERGAEQLTGLDKVEISSNENILDLNKVKLNNGLENASISFGKYLTTDLYIEYRTQFNQGVPAPSLSWDSGNRLGLEYRINRFWSLDSYYEKTMQGNNKIQLGLNWEYNF